MKFPRVWGAEMKNSDPNHPKPLSWVNYLPHLLANLIDSMAFKSVRHSVITHQISHIIALYFESLVSSTWGGAEIKNSDPNHSYALYRVYYTTHLLRKIIGCITFNSSGTPSYLIKSHIQLHCTSKAEVSSTLGGC